MIEIANRATDLLREKYGLPEYRVPSENYHLIKEKNDNRMPQHGAFSVQRQAIAIKEDHLKSRLLSSLFHETVHFKSYASLHGDAPDLIPRRSGLNMTIGKERERAFGALNEAVTEELAKRFMRAQEDLPMLADEMDLLQRGREKYGAEEMEDIVAVEVKDHPTDRDLIKVAVYHFAYRREREALRLLIDKLQERNPQVFRDKEEWFDLFASAMFNGHLLELARNIEKTFGEGSFRKLGEQKNGEELLKYVESL